MTLVRGLLICLMYILFDTAAASLFPGKAAHLGYLPKRAPGIAMQVEGVVSYEIFGLPILSVEDGVLIATQFGEALVQDFTPGSSLTEILKLFCKVRLAEKIARLD